MSLRVAGFSSVSVEVYMITLCRCSHSNLSVCLCVCVSLIVFLLWCRHDRRNARRSYTMRGVLPRGQCHGNRQLGHEREAVGSSDPVQCWHFHPAGEGTARSRRSALPLCIVCITFIPLTASCFRFTRCLWLGIG